ncbi:MAG: Crp/Fnr family transcriptional regulator [Proteobacteria bacterium]|nr:Crp/Fnr family transcriptional regulator [Pseudomonadota bacterium]
MNISDDLRKTLLFSGLSEEDLKEIAKIVIVKEYPKKSIIFSEGDEAKGFYILLSGMVKIYRISTDSREQILHIINPGETFAEAAIFIGKNYPAFAETILDSRLAYIDKKIFLKTLEKNSKIALNLIISLSMLLKKVVDLVDNVSLKNVDARLAEFLIEEAIRKGKKIDDYIEIELNITKTELAKKLGTVNETLSRSLRKLREKGIIDAEKNKVYIFELEKLQEIKTLGSLRID